MMFGLLTWPFRQKEKHPRVVHAIGDSDDMSPARRAALEKGVDGAIRYEPGLIAKLKTDHHKLTGLFMAISQAADSGHFDEIPGLLGKFKLALQTHVMTENVKFYAYMQDKFAHDTGTASHLADVRKEMDGITRDIAKFANQFSTKPPTGATIADFKKALAKVGEGLTTRVDFEEKSLYPLYSE